MPLTETFVKNVKPCKETGEKYSDGEGMYLLVTLGGKYWRFDYRYLGKRKTLALGVYPVTTVAKARLKRASARALLADGIDPSAEKKQEKQRRFEQAIQTFESVASTWLIKTAAERAPTTQEKSRGSRRKTPSPTSARCRLRRSSLAMCSWQCSE